MPLKLFLSKSFMLLSVHSLCLSGRQLVAVMNHSMMRMRMMMMCVYWGVFVHACVWRISVFRVFFNVLRARGWPTWITVIIIDNYNYSDWYV